jgi:hypothetical protein
MGARRKREVKMNPWLFAHRTVSAFAFSEEDAVLVHEKRSDGYVPTSRECFPLPGDWKPGVEAKRDHAMACAAASYGAVWEPTNGFDRLVLSDDSLTTDRIYEMLNQRAG